MSASVVFALRGGSVAARYSSSGKNPLGWFSNATNIGGATGVSGLTGEIGGSSINLVDAGNNGYLFYPGYNNVPSTPGISVLFRGTAQHVNSFIGLWGIGMFNLTTCPGALFLNLSNTNTLNLTQVDFACLTGINNVSVASGMSTGVIYDIVFTWDGTTNANAANLYVNNVLIKQYTSTHGWSAITYPPALISLGASNGVGADSWLNEFIIFSGIVNTASISCGGSNVALNGNARTAFVDCNAFDGSINVGAGAANIRSGSSETIAGVVTNGSLVVPTLANTKINVAGDGGTGTYDGSDRWDTIPGTNVLVAQGTFKANSTTPNVTPSAVAAAAATTKIGVTANDGVGTYDGSERYTDFGNSNIRSGQTGKYNSTTNNRTGTAKIAAAVSTKIGVTADDGPGSYDGSDRWTAPLANQLARGVQLKNNSLTLNLTGTLDNVTNIIEGATLVGGNAGGTLVAE